MHQPLTREQMISVIEGKGAAPRIPCLYHIWVREETFGDRVPALRELIAHYPNDIQQIPFRMPEVFEAPTDDPEYRWLNFDDPTAGQVRAIDEVKGIEDWEAQLDGVLADFPNPDYPGLFPDNPVPDGRYRLGNWWRFLFERFWSMRGMTNALMDFYEYPDEVHRVLDKLADFYCRMLERAKDLRIDGVFVSDDLGTQASTFFSPEIFDEFFAPYYQRVIEKAHALGLHFWLHSCGNISTLLPRLIECGIDVLHPIQKHTMDEKKIAERFGSDLCIWAGFDMQQIIPWGTPEEVRAEVRYLIDTYARPEGRLMLTAGNGINGDCTLSALEALLDESVNYRGPVART